MWRAAIRRRRRSARSARSNTSGGWPPEIRWRSSMITAGTEWMPSCCQWRSRSRTSAREFVGVEDRARALDVEADLAGERAAGRRARPGSRHRVWYAVSSACLSARCSAPGCSPAQWSRRCASKVFQTRGRSPKLKPTAAPRSRRTARVLRELLGRGAVLAREVLGRVLALGRHRRIELERLEVQLDRDLVVEPLERLLERPEADRAPGAGDVGDEIDLHRLGRWRSQSSDAGPRAGRSRAHSKVFFALPSTRARCAP